MSELKPCPFCGKPGRLWDGPLYTKVECSNQPSCCWSWLEDTHTQAGLVTSWNHRTPGPATRAMLEMAKEVIDATIATPVIIDACAKFLAEWSEQGGQ